MKFFDRIDRNTDYNNSYSIKKSVSILENEFNLAIKKNNIYYAREILDTTTKIYDKFSSTYRESEDYGETMSYMQKIWAKRLRQLIGYFIWCLKNNFEDKNSVQTAQHKTV